MKFRGIKWSEMVKMYDYNSISAVNFPIVDMDVVDMSVKLRKAAEILQLLIQKYNKVYVHCTAGVFRSPQIVNGYYQFYK
jgi:protein-tyrosine phosphatase